MADKKHWRIGPIKKTGATYRVVFGQRGPGKTFGVLYDALKEYLDTGKRLAIVRRMDEDFVGSKSAKNYYLSLSCDANNFNNIADLTGGEYTGIEYFDGRYWFTGPGEDGKTRRSSDWVAYGFSISSQEHYKGTRYNDVGTVMFDEFVATKFYLRDEFVEFQNLLSTIIGSRPGVVIYMLGNSINPFCPYFKEMGLTRVREQKPGTIDIYSYGESGMTVAVEHTDIVAANKTADMYFAFDNPKLKMITSAGAWAIDIYPHCPTSYKPKDIVFIFFILFDEVAYQCEVVNTGKEVFLFIHVKTSPLQDPDHDLIYSLDRDPRPNWRVNITKPGLPVEKKIAQFFISNRVYYQDNTVGNSIENYIKQARRVVM